MFFIIQQYEEMAALVQESVEFFVVLAIAINQEFVSWGGLCHFFTRACRIHCLPDTKLGDSSLVVATCGSYKVHAVVDGLG